MPDDFVRKGRNLSGKQIRKARGYAGLRLHYYLRQAVNHQSNQVFHRDILGI